MAANPVDYLITGGIAVVALPFIVMSYIRRDKPGTTFGPTVCSRCGVELRGWNSSGRKQMWFRTDSRGNKIYFCARCKDK